jgi:spore germination protein GerM
MWARFNNNADSVYSMHQFVSFGASTGSTYNSTASFNIIERLAGGGAVSDVFGAIIWDIYDYNSTKTKTSKALGGVESNTNNTNGSVYFNGNLYTGTDSIQSIQLAQETGNFVENTIISLYGVK